MAHDFSPSAVLEQVILPARFRFVVIILEAILIVSFLTAGVFIARGSLDERRLGALNVDKDRLATEKKTLVDELAKRQADHLLASNEAAWVRRNMPMQPMALEILNSVTANVTLHQMEAEMAEGGAPQMTIKLQLKGTPEAVDQAMTQINDAFYHMNLRVLAPALPVRGSQYTEVSFAVQFPNVEEIIFSTKHG